MSEDAAAAAAVRVRARLTQEEEELQRLRRQIADFERALDTKPFAPPSVGLSSRQAVQDELELPRKKLPALQDLVLVYAQRVQLVEQQQQQQGCAGLQQGRAAAAAGGDPLGQAAAAHPEHTLSHADNERMKDAWGCVGLITHHGERAGTVVRLTQDGLCVSAAHVLLEEEECLHMRAWGQPLRLVASCPSEDIIFLQGKEGTAMDLTSNCHLLPTIKFKAVSFPLVAHGDHKTPVVVHGVVSAITPSHRVALGTCHTAMPTAPGGVVLDEQFRFAGIDTGILRVDEVHNKPAEGEVKAQVQPYTIDLPADGYQSDASEKSARMAGHEPEADQEPDEDEDAVTAPPSPASFSDPAMNAQRSTPGQDHQMRFIPASAIIRLLQRINPEEFPLAAYEKAGARSKGSALS